MIFVHKKQFKYFNMKTIKLLFGISLLSMLFVNCDTLKLENANFNQKILFEAGYANYAWSPTHSGFLIDSIGNVYCYNLPSKWKDVDSLNQISEQDMDTNLGQTNGICMSINKEELKSKLILLSKAASATTTKPKNEMADAGGAYYLGYTFNTQTKTYNKILLKQTGDWVINNNSKAAEDLTIWLSAIKQQINNLPD